MNWHEASDGMAHPPSALSDFTQAVNSAMGQTAEHKNKLGNMYVKKGTMVGQI